MIPLTIPEIKRLLAALHPAHAQGGSSSIGTPGPAAKPGHDDSDKRTILARDAEFPWSGSKMRLPY